MSHDPDALAQDEPPVRVVRREVVHQSRAFTVIRDLQQLPDGSQHHWESVVFGGSALVLPLDAHGYVYLLDQYRPLIERRSLEVVGGRIDDGESAAEAAHRELQEEAGITARLIPLGAPELSTAAVRSTEHLFLALVESFGETSPEVFERQTLGPIRRLPLGEAVELVIRGEIVHLATVALVLLAAEYVRRDPTHYQASPERV